MNQNIFFDHFSYFSFVFAFAASPWVCLRYVLTFMVTYTEMKFVILGRDVAPRCFCNHYALRRTVTTHGTVACCSTESPRGTAPHYGSATHTNEFENVMVRDIMAGRISVVEL